MKVVWVQTIAVNGGKGVRKRGVKESKVLQVIITDDEEVKPQDGVRVLRFNGATMRVQLELDPPLENVIVTKAEAERILRAEGYVLRL
jgi:hypothetical protein